MSEVEDLFESDDNKNQIDDSENGEIDTNNDEGLFGDDDEDVLIKPKRPIQSVDADIEDDEDEQESEEEKIIRIKEDVIPRYASSQKSSDSYFVRMPAFITLEPRPFDVSKFLDEAKQAEKENQSLVKLADENTVRWRYAREKDTMVKQSNARFIVWSDGSRSLQLGNELFDVETQDLYDASFLCLSHTENELLQTSSLLTKSAKFVPSSTKSNTHIKLAQALTKKQLQSVSAVHNYATTDDPEKIQREAEKQQQLAMKARRKLESKREQQESEYGYSTATRRRKVTGSTYELDEDEERELMGSRRRAAEEYEEDDFVVDDEEGAEEIASADEDEDLLDADDAGDSDDNAERLRQVKQQGEESYRDHKKRRVIDDEEDD